MRRTSALLSTVIAAVAVTMVAGCGGSETPAGSGSSAVKGTVTVFAAASLQDSFTKLGKQFEAAHPGSKVVFDFGPSSGLAEQIKQDAPADVFASASTKSMDLVVAAGDAVKPTNFAKNTMQIAVPPDNPAGVRTVADLAKKNVKVALCQAQVPCGSTALKVFDNAGIKVTPVTQEVDVKAALSKVKLDEVDAAVVYVTDVLAAGNSVKGIAIPNDINASTTYPIAPITGSQNKTTAQAFVDYVLSADGLAALSSAGFAKP